jgi:hypothetical protein
MNLKCHPEAQRPQGISGPPLLQVVSGAESKDPYRCEKSQCRRRVQQEVWDCRHCR